MQTVLRQHSKQVLRYCRLYNLKLTLFTKITYDRSSSSDTIITICPSIYIPVPTSPDISSNPSVIQKPNAIRLTASHQTMKDPSNSEAPCLSFLRTQLTGRNYLLLLKKEGRRIKPNDYRRATGDLFEPQNSMTTRIYNS